MSQESGVMEQLVAAVRSVVGDPDVYSGLEGVGHIIDRQLERCATAFERCATALERIARLMEAKAAGRPCTCTEPAAEVAAGQCCAAAPVEASAVGAAEEGLTDESIKEWTDELFTERPPFHGYSRRMLMDMCHSAKIQVSTRANMTTMWTKLAKAGRLDDIAIKDGII